MEQEIKLITYNIDGLPETLDLNDLPWILKPIVWIYKLIKGTTIIKINDGNNRKEKIEKINKYLSSSDADIIGVQEDFNYHDELMSDISENYEDSTHTGKIELKNFFSITEWLTCFPLPRFKADGLNFLHKKEKIVVVEEKIITWDKSCGYFKHANDTLTHKGFRQYSMAIYGTMIDVYLIHMDADYYHDLNEGQPPIDIKAREAQLKQLTNYIINRYDSGYKRPSIIFGDTNSSDKFEWDRENFENNLFKPINERPNLEIKEAIPTNLNDVDRMFYINNSKSKVILELIECYYDENARGLSDHIPFITKLKIKNLH